MNECKRFSTQALAVVVVLIGSASIQAQPVNNGPDVIVGDLWYAAPDWKPHEIRKPRKPNRGGYTEAFAVYADDFNKDGWADVLVIPFHGKDAKWYENPHNKPGHWKARVAFPKTGNETRIYPDLFGDGKPVFLMSVHGKISWVAVPADPTKMWDVHTIAKSLQRQVDVAGFIEVSRSAGIEAHRGVV